MIASEPAAGLQWIAPSASVMHFVFASWPLICGSANGAPKRPDSAGSAETGSGGSSGPIASCSSSWPIAPVGAAAPMAQVAITTYSNALRR